MTSTRRSFAVHVGLSVIAVLCVAWCVWMYQRHVDRREPLWQAGAPAWDHHPVRVYFDAAEYAPYADVIVASMGLWNSAAGCELLARTRDLSDADVVIRPPGAVPCGTSFEGDKAPIWTCYLNAPAGAITETRALGDTSGELLRFTHEGGHWLGLGHRRDGSIMEPVIDDPLPGDPPPAALISRYLADQVRGRWCP